MKSVYHATSRLRAYHCFFLLALVSAVSLAWFLPSNTASGRPTGPAETDTYIAMAVSRLMEIEHLSGHALDDEMGKRALDTYLKSLDPLKLYFYQSDVDEFRAQQSNVDNLLSEGKLAFAHAVFNRFLDRLEERMKTAHEQLDKPHDFTIDEEVVSDADAASYPKTPEEAEERWRKRVKFDLLREIADEVEIEEAVKKLHNRYESNQKAWLQTDNDELLERFLTSMTSGYDPHSSYMSSSTLEDFEIAMRLELDGIGASLRPDDGYTEVVEVIPGGAADRDGRLKAGDRIIGVGQNTDGEIADVVDVKLRDVVRQIRGKKGTVVRLEVIPVDNPAAREIYNITRDRIELTNQEARGEVIQYGQKPDGTPYRFGVIQLPSFYMDMTGARLGLPTFKSSTRDVRRLLTGFNAQGVDGVVVDLRMNGGGSLTEAVNMTGLFIDRGPVVQVKGSDGRRQPYDDREPGMAWSGPLVVVTNRFSASASEIFAGAIQDYRRGIVVGDHSTHGKGTVQQIFDVANILMPFDQEAQYGALKLTIQQFYLPGGNSTQNRGVLADIELPSERLSSHLEVGESDLEYAVAFDKVPAIEHQRYHMVSGEIIGDLQRRSQQRVSDSDYFNKQLKRIARVIEQNDQTTVTLNKEKYLALRSEFDVEKEEEELVNSQNKSDRPVFEMSDYGKEVLNVAVDYLQSLGTNLVAVAR